MRSRNFHRVIKSSRRAEKGRRIIMDVILLEDVKSLGKKGDLVKVSDGYARNFILPKKLGLEATPKNLNDLKLQKAASSHTFLFYFWK